MILSIVTAIVSVIHRHGSVLDRNVHLSEIWKTLSIIINIDSAVSFGAIIEAPAVLASEGIFMAGDTVVSHIVTFVADPEALEAFCGHVSWSPVADLALAEVFMDVSLGRKGPFCGVCVVEFVVYGAAVVVQVEVGRAFGTIKEGRPVTVVTMIVTNNLCIIEGIGRVLIETVISLIANRRNVITVRAGSVTRCGGHIIYDLSNGRTLELIIELDGLDGSFEMKSYGLGPYAVIVLAYSTGSGPVFFHVHYMPFDCLLDHRIIINEHLDDGLPPLPVPEEIGSHPPPSGLSLCVIVIFDGSEFIYLCDLDPPVIDHEY